MDDRFSFDDRDFFNPGPVRYSTALGDAGLSMLRRAVDDRPAASDRDFAVRYVQERLAVLDGDIDRIVELLGGDLTGTYQFIRAWVAPCVFRAGLSELVRPVVGRWIVGGPEDCDPRRSRIDARALDWRSVRPSQASVFDV